VGGGYKEGRGGGTLTPAGEFREELTSPSSCSHNSSSAQRVGGGEPKGGGKGPMAEVTPGPCTSGSTVLWTYAAWLYTLHIMRHFPISHLLDASVLVYFHRLLKKVPHGEVLQREGWFKGGGGQFHQAACGA
jgi:hypothetical protein